jgi:hypothetical protein
MSDQLQATATLHPGKDPTAHWRGGWLGSNGCLGTVKRRISFLVSNQISAKLTALPELDGTKIYKRNLNFKSK